MSDNKHGEPWEVEYDSEYASVNLYDKDGKGIFLHTEVSTLNRAVLCVNACAGMSDEGIRQVGDFKELLNKAYRSAMESVTLKSDLDEAVGLLKDAAYRRWNMETVEAFLTRMETRHGE